MDDFLRNLLLKFPKKKPQNFEKVAEKKPRKEISEEIYSDSVKFKVG